MHLTINDGVYDVVVPGHERLSTTLRETLGLTGTKVACGRGECGACTVLLDGTPAYACMTLTAACRDRVITTIEGAGAARAGHALRDAFIAHDAVQCGFCTPGQIVAATALLTRNAHPTENDVVRAMSGNLCRCGTYPKIIRAVLAAAQQASDPGSV
ncbi:MAG TPA: (2Fe-2S)-binding protein [Gemmatimonadaceae bacterium]|nr:(2Fe-2S)-binding protein [Gemmatimonadaceae bacterium]